MAIPLIVASTAEPRATITLGRLESTHRTKYPLMYIDAQLATVSSDTQKTPSIHASANRANVPVTEAIGGTTVASRTIVGRVASIRTLLLVPLLTTHSQPLGSGVWITACLAT